MTSSPATTPFLSIIEYDVDGAATQRELAAAFVHLQEQWVRSYPGYVSSQIVASTDGRRLSNIVTWASEDAYREFEETSDGEGRMAAIQAALDSLTGHAESRMDGLPHYRLLHAVTPPDRG